MSSNFEWNSFAAAANRFPFRIINIFLTCVWYPISMPWYATYLSIYIQITFIFFSFNNSVLFLSFLFQVSFFFLHVRAISIILMEECLRVTSIPFTIRLRVRQHFFMTPLHALASILQNMRIWCRMFDVVGTREYVRYAQLADTWYTA